MNANREIGGPGGRRTLSDFELRGLASGPRDYVVGVCVLSVTFCASCLSGPSEAAATEVCGLAG